MVEIQVKYGKIEIPFEISEKNLYEIVRPKNEPPGIIRTRDQVKEIERAIEHPIGSPALGHGIISHAKVIITHDDYTRGTPGYLMLPPLLNTLNARGVPDENITLIFATGIHRAVKPEEMSSLVGEEVLERISCVCHDCDANLVKVGTTSRKTEVAINSLAAEADYIITTGKVEYHFYAGFSGGRKSILPGISGRDSINHNHAFLIDEKAITGNLLNNPVHDDMVEASKMIKDAFMVNLVLNTQRNLIRAFAGNLISAHLEAAKLYDSLYRTKVRGLADIVLVSAGFPKDINLYQGYKAIDNAQRIVRPGGVIVAALECREGHGDHVFYNWAKKYRTLEELEHQIKTNFEIGGHKAYYIARVQKKARIILVSTMNPTELKEIFKIESAKTVEDAIELAFTLVGREAKVTFMPNGTLILPTL